MLSQLTRYASEFDVPIRKAELEIRVTFDPRGKLMLDDTPASAQMLIYRWDLESTASTAQVSEVLNWIERGCHTLGSLRDPVPLSGSAVLNGAAIWESARRQEGGS
jgi:hypothetical protein